MKRLFLIIFILISLSSNIQSENGYFIDLYGGTQVSGIRKVDYQAHNFAPYIQFGVGKWIVPYMALSINYQGPYFNYISDNFKHKYVYVDGELLFNISNLCKIDSKYFNLYAQVGSGLFHNQFHSHYLVCATMGIINEIKLTNNWSLKLKFSNIMGWDIYQGNEDAVTNYSVGVSWAF